MMDASRVQTGPIQEAMDASSGVSQLSGGVYLSVLDVSMIAEGNWWSRSLGCLGGEVDKYAFYRM